MSWVGTWVGPNTRRFIDFKGVAGHLTSSQAREWSDT
jgi:hypothetical protein